MPVAAHQAEQLSYSGYQKFAPRRDRRRASRAGAPSLFLLRYGRQPRWVSGYQSFVVQKRAPHTRRKEESTNVPCAFEPPQMEQFKRRTLDMNDLCDVSRK